MATPMVAAFFDEFPFLSRHYSMPGGPIEVKVQRLDLNLIERTLDPDFMPYRSIWFFNKEGEVLARVGIGLAPNPNKTWLQNLWDWIKSIGDEPPRASVYDIIQLLKDRADEVCYIVDACYEQGPSLDHIHVYKMPIGRTLREFVDELRANASVEVSKEHEAVERG
jgi:hypothetical protein